MEEDGVDENKQNGRRFTYHQGKNEHLEETEESPPSPQERPGQWRDPAESRNMGQR